MNFGTGGDGTRPILWRLDHGAVDGLAPRAAVLMIGTNNRRRGDATPESISKGVGAIPAKLGEKLPGATVLPLGVFPTQPNPGHPGRTLFAETNTKPSARVDGRRGGGPGPDGPVPGAGRDDREGDDAGLPAPVGQGLPDPGRGMEPTPKALPGE